jgi:hypothetical protein
MVFMIARQPRAAPGSAHRRTTYRRDDGGDDVRAQKESGAPKCAAGGAQVDDDVSRPSAA